MARLESMFDGVLEEATETACREIEARGLSPEEADKYVSRVTEAIPEALRETVAPLIERLKQSAPEMLQERRESRRGYSEMIQAHWGDAFDAYEIVLRIAFELGDDFVRARIEDGDDSTVGPVLTRLQARACRIAEEVLVLMKAGYAQGALARWRALHEVAVVAMFIGQHGEETARRYLAHEYVEAWWAIKDYLGCYERLGYEAPPADEVRLAERNFEAVVGEFGSSFKGQFGWAADVFAGEGEEGSKPPRIGLRDLEKNVGVDHLRAHYRHASHPVHPQATGTMSSPDLMPELEGGALAGPAPRGMADPGHGALISLTQATMAVLMLTAGPGAIVYGELMVSLSDEAGERFIEAHRALDEDGFASEI
ncbi:MAG: DUF5677 domain-containing protein [Solirubrobacterales bacterium]